MVADTASAPKGAERTVNRTAEEPSASKPIARRPTVPFARTVRNLGLAATSSLSRRILLLNLAALLTLVAGILFLNSFRAGLIDARVDSLLTQGQIIAAAIAGQATVETDAITIDPDSLLELQAGESTSTFPSDLTETDFPINPERIAPLLSKLISPTRTRARIYDQEGVVLLDSQGIYTRGDILRFELPPLDTQKSWFREVWEGIRLWYRRGDLPPYRELGAANGRDYPEVAAALEGSAASIVRVGDDGGLIVSVAVPVQRFRAVLGALLLSTVSGDIDAIVEAERIAIVRVFLVAAIVTAVLSVLLASTIAGPVRRLSDAAQRIRRGIKKRVEIPDFGNRKDEIGHLSQSLREMTDALYNRMDAIESFAADVSHELKNPLTSLRSAVETMPIVKTIEARNRLLEVIENDVQRLDRLITDISDASRLDAELAREDSEPVNIATLLETVASIGQETHVHQAMTVEVNLEPGAYGKDAFYVLGFDSRLGQVFVNLLDNALSFSPDHGLVSITARRLPHRIEITVDDEGPGINAEDKERVFERFYTDRPGAESFGKNSGLGLAISKQIVDAHRGTITAMNRLSSTGFVIGARFVVVLPAAG